MAYVLAQPAALLGRLRPGHEYVAPYHRYAGFCCYLTASQIETVRPELGGRTLSGLGTRAQRAGLGVAARNHPEDDTHQDDGCQTEEQKDPSRQFGFTGNLHNANCVEVILYEQVVLEATAGPAGGPQHRRRALLKLLGYGA